MLYFFLILLVIFMFMCSLHPLMLIGQTIIVTLICSWFITQMFSTSWLSMILLLIFLGGLLIIFVYLSSMVPNEMMVMSFKFLYLLPTAYYLQNFIITSMPEMMMMKKMMTFSVSNYNMIIPLILLYMIVGLSVTIYMTSIMKYPSKQEMN